LACGEQSPPSYNRAVHIQLKAGKSSNFGRTSRDRNSSLALAKRTISDFSVDFGEANLGLRTSPAIMENGAGHGWQRQPALR
jgi:hypothetical protein